MAVAAPLPEEAPVGRVRRGVARGAVEVAHVLGAVVVQLVAEDEFVRPVRCVSGV